MDGRDSKGRFLPGHCGNRKGQPHKQKAEYLDILADTLTAKRWRAIVDKAIADAETGDKAARTWLSNYILGRPVEHVKAEVVGIPMTLQEWRAERARRREEAEEC